MKSLTKKLLASVFVMVFALVAVATTTFAWFTISNETQVETIDVNVKTDSGDLVFLVNKAVANDAYVTSDYSKSINWATIKKAIYPSGVGSMKFEPITSTDGTAFGLLVDPVTLKTNYATEHTSASKANDGGQYLSFKLTFKASASGYLVLTTNTNATAKDVTVGENEAVHAFTLEHNITNYNGTKNASDTQATDGHFNKGDTITSNPVDPLRISFINGSTTYVRLWNPETTLKHKADASDKNSIALSTGNLAVEFYKSVWSDNTTVNDQLTAALAYDANLINQLKYATSLKPAGTLDAADVSKVNNVVLGLFAKANDTLDITVNIWMEGWDADCFNGIINTGVLTTLGFALLKAESPSL